ncbi:MAG: hypothetical protein VX012_06385, partial [Planctomycetota bacterium]|nr:hypothetical protein [Planctomycetota bacterium]
MLSRFFKSRPNRRRRIAAALRPKSPSVAELLRQPRFAYGGVAVVVAAVLLTTIVVWGRTQPRVWVGQVATDSLVNPRAFDLPDLEETGRQQDVARLAAPRVYQANAAVLDDLRAKIAGLPVAVRSVTILEEVAPDLRDRFELKDDSLSVLKRFAGTNGPDAAPNWRDWTDEFVRRLWTTEPLLDSQEFQKFSTVS